MRPGSVTGNCWPLIDMRPRIRQLREIIKDTFDIKVEDYFLNQGNISDEGL